MENLSNQLSLFAVQGPRAAEALQLAHRRGPGRPFHTTASCRARWPTRRGSSFRPPATRGRAASNCTLPNEYAAPGVGEQILAAGQPFGMQAYRPGCPRHPAPGNGLLPLRQRHRPTPPRPWKPAWAGLPSSLSPSPTAKNLQGPKSRRRDRASSSASSWTAPAACPAAHYPLVNAAGASHWRGNQRRAVAERSAKASAWATCAPSWPPPARRFLCRCAAKTCPPR